MYFYGEHSFRYLSLFLLPYNKEYYLNNKEKWKEYKQNRINKFWREEVKRKFNEVAKKYYDNHKEECIRRAREYQKNHLSKYRELKEKRRKTESHKEYMKINLPK